MKYQFRPYAMMQPIAVTLTGKVYEKGEHPLYTEHKIIEVVDEEGEMHYAFEDELKSDEVKEQERSYSEQEAFNLLMDFWMEERAEYKMNPVCVSNWFEKFKIIKDETVKKDNENWK